MKTLGLNLPDNCTLKFHANGIIVSVSLNIEKELLKYIPKGRAAKGEKYLVYFIEQNVPLKFCSAKNITDTYNVLLNRAMQNVRKRKQEMLDDQIKKLEQSQIKLSF